MYSQVRMAAKSALIALSVFAVGQSQTPPAANTQAGTTGQKARKDRPVTLVMPEVDLGLTVPPGENAWVVQINTGGGLMGTTSDSLIITSAGDVTCNGAKPATGNLSTSELQGLSKLVAALSLGSAVPFDQRTREPISLCSDCPRATLALSRREAKNKIKTYLTAWDAVTFALLPEDLTHLFENASRVLPCRR